ncbi:MAG: sugar phosphate isomerase/epimerase [Bacilli bacterium]|nr:sugar phosphate isomerase/epimerase [Bacilli bacterium]
MRKFKLGVMVYLNDNIKEEFAKVKDFGIETCQLGCWNLDLLTEYYAELVNEAKEEIGIEITAFWCGWPGPRVWNFYEGQLTLGLIPETYRYARMEALIKGGKFAKLINVSHIITHAGFIPENPFDPNYQGVVTALRHVAKSYHDDNQYLLFETGQETPITLKRLIMDINLPNLGINLDPANLLMYGKANPVDALDIFGEYVKGVHAKDGEYPTDPRYLGKEKPLGEGRVNFPNLLKKLDTLGYQGSLTIEREISGPEQMRDIKLAIKYLDEIMESL